MSDSHRDGRSSLLSLYYQELNIFIGGVIMGKTEVLNWLKKEGASALKGIVTEELLKKMWEEGIESIPLTDGTEKKTGPYYDQTGYHPDGRQLKFLA